MNQIMYVYGGTVNGHGSDAAVVVMITVSLCAVVMTLTHHDIDCVICCVGISNML